jgi:hypothetical protein
MVLSSKPAPSDGRSTEQDAVDATPNRGNYRAKVSQIRSRADVIASIRRRDDNHRAPKKPLISAVLRWILDAIRR